MTVTGNGSNRFLDTGTLRIDGTANWTGTSITYLQDGATIEIGPGATLDSKVDHTFSLNIGTGNIHVLAGGTLTKSAGSGTTSISVPLENDGTVSASAGRLRLNGGSSASSGTWSPSGAGVVEFAGGTHSLGGTTLNGTGKAEGTTRSTPARPSQSTAPTAGRARRSRARARPRSPPVASS